ITPAWTGSVTTRSAWSGTEPAILRETTRMPRALTSSTAWVTSPTLREPGHAPPPPPGQPGHPPHGVGQVGLADDRDGVDADLLAPDVVPVGLADGPDGDLPALGPGPDDDDPLAPYLVHGGQALERLDHVDLQERRHQPFRVLDAVQLPVDDATPPPAADA